MYDQTTMQQILHNPAKMAEAAANLAQTYYEQFNRMARGEQDVDLNNMHQLNNQLTAIVIAQGQHIFLNVTISSIQQAQERLSNLAPKEADSNINTNESIPETSNVVQLQVKKVELNQIHQEPEGTQ